MRPSGNVSWSALRAIRLVVLSLTIAAGVAAPVTSHGALERELVVGSEVDYPPFALGEAGGTPDGFTVDLWMAVAKEMGFKYRFRVQPFNEILGDFRTGKIDVLINLAYSSERARFADFSAPHVVSYGTIFARGGSFQFDSEEELKARSIIVLSGDLLHDYALAAGYRNLVLVKDVAAGMRLLNEGKHDAMLVSRLAGLQTLKQINLKSIDPVGAPVRGVVQRFGFAVRHGDSDLLAQINEGMAIVRMNGTYLRLYEKWFGAIDPRPVTPMEVAKILAPAALVIFLIGLAYFYQRRLNATLAVRVMERTSDLTATLHSLRESEARFRCLTEMSSDFYWESDAEHRITRRTASEREAADPVFRRESIIGVLRWEVPHHSPDEAGWLAHRALLDAHLPFRDFEISRHGSNETLIHVSVSGDPVFDEAGNFTGYRGVGSDITERKQAEETLRESEERLRAIFDVANAGISIVDRNGKYVMLNNRWAESLGFDSEELKNLTYEDVTHPDDLAVARKRFLELIDGKVDRYRSEKRYVRKDGSVFWADLSVSAIKDQNNSVTRVVGMLVDITERKAAELALSASEQRFRQMFDMTPIPLGYVGKDGVLLAFNTRFARTFGYTVEDVPTIEVWWRLAYPDPDYRRWVLATWEAAVRSAAAAGADIEPIECRVTCKNGAVRLVEISGILLGDDVLTVFLDVTERRRAEEQLRKLSLAVEQSPESIVITNTDAELEYVNEAFVQATGYSREEVIGQNPKILHSGKTPKETYDALWQALTQGQAWKGEFYNKRKDGSEYIEFAIIQPLRQADGTVSHYVAVKEDITERKQAAVELDAHRHHLEELVFTRTAELARSRDDAEAANRAKSIFLATMSHELRTPMNGIMGMTDLALRRASDPQQIDWLNKSKGSARHLLAVINDILDISRMEAQQLTLDENDFSLAQVVEAALCTQDEAARAKGLSLSGTIDPALPDLLCGDAQRLRQILTHFIGNAVKFSERGQITVCASAAAEDSHSVLLRIEVADQGIGISPEERARLFQAFTQADGSSTRKHGGSGLGLIICKRLALLMGGEVGADSTPGEGSAFWFSARLRRGNGIATAPAMEHGVSGRLVETAPAPTLPAGGNGGNECAADPVRARAVLDQLEPLLATDDTRAGDLFEANRFLLLATLGAEAMQLERQVRAFDYPEALTTVQKLIRQTVEIQRG